MAYEVEGKVLETDANGYLVNANEWDQKVAEVIAAAEGITLTQEHWDIMEYLRDEYLNGGGNQPNERTILKAMSDKWGRNATTKDMYMLFPKMPSKQGAKVAGLPESRRKGGY
ncbi:MAG: TusE/DsrC/DsvC family sulfur relay protein [Gammaproteobacteria bacterium]|nr:TusE/DsrC/DsvC family sulfur relay protein [Gammaproteobacteria bacterium]